MGPGRKDHVPKQESHGGEHGSKLTKIQANDEDANPGHKQTKTQESQMGERSTAIPGRTVTKGPESQRGEHSSTIPGRKTIKGQESQAGEHSVTTPGHRPTKDQASDQENHEHSVHVLIEMPSTITDSTIDSELDAKHRKEGRETTRIRPKPTSPKVSPTKVVPLYRCRQVLLKIGDNFLRVGNGNTPVISKLRPPLHPPNEDKGEIQLPVRRRRKRRGDADHRTFNFQDFVFLADESATQKQSWYNTEKTFFNIRLGIRRPESKPDGSLTYLSAFRSPGTNHYEVRYDTDCTGCPWWTLIAVHRHSYMAHPLLCPDRCLMAGVPGLRLSPPLTRRDRARIAAGVWDASKTLTVLSLPDFAVWCPAVVIE